MRSYAKLSYLHPLWLILFLRASVRRTSSFDIRSVKEHEEDDEGNEEQRDATVLVSDLKGHDLWQEICQA